MDLGHLEQLWRSNISGLALKILENLNLRNLKWLKTQIKSSLKLKSWPKLGLKHTGWHWRQNISSLKFIASNETWTHNHQLPKQTLNHLAKLGKWLSVRLRTKWLCDQIPLLSVKLQTWCQLQPRSSLTFRQTNRVWIQYETRTRHDNNLHR